jgi:hypothetical protein
MIKIKSNQSNQAAIAWWDESAVLPAKYLYPWSDGRASTTTALGGPYEVALCFF